MKQTKYRSGEKRVSGRISQKGDISARNVLDELAGAVLAPPIKAAGLNDCCIRLVRLTGDKAARGGARIRNNGRPAAESRSRYVLL